MDELRLLIGKDLNQLNTRFGISINRNAKHYLNLVTKRVIESIGEKYDCEVKVILIKNNGVPKEHMSFEQIRYENIVKEQWEISALRNRLSRRMLWVVYETKIGYKRQTNLKLDDIKLKKVFIWNMPKEDLDKHMRVVWENPVQKLNNRDYNFMRYRDNPVGHVRPKGRNKKDTVDFKGDYIGKKCFWLNKTYVADQIERN